jgi:hypothetical protein
VKNRFGSTNELGVFEMTGAGLSGVPDPSEVFGKTVAGEPGAAVACALEGTRPILLEIQALVAQSELAMPRRVATGVDPKRLAMIVAVISRHAGVPLGQADVFVNVAGGVRIDEPGADLAIALAIASAARRVPMKEGHAAFGEIGLTGRLRTAAQAERRLEECKKLGLTAVVAPVGTPDLGDDQDRGRRNPPRGGQSRARSRRVPLGERSGFGLVRPFLLPSESEAGAGERAGFRGGRAHFQTLGGRACIRSVTRWSIPTTVRGRSSRRKSARFSASSASI